MTGQIWHASVFSDVTWRSLIRIQSFKTNMSNWTAEELYKQIRLSFYIHTSRRNAWVCYKNLFNSFMIWTHCQKKEQILILGVARSKLIHFIFGFISIHHVIDTFINVCFFHMMQKYTKQFYPLMTSVGELPLKQWNEQILNCKHFVIWIKFIKTRNQRKWSQRLIEIPPSRWWRF